MDVDARTSRALEWDRLRSYLAAETSCVASASMARALVPEKHEALVRLLLDQTTEALALVTAGSSLSQEGLPAAEDLLARLSAAAPLSLSELVDLRTVLTLSRATHKSLALLEPGDFPQLHPFTAQLAVCQDLINALNGAIDDHGAIRDDASPALRRLRKEAARLAGLVQTELHRIINSHNGSKALQELITTQRNGRWVLPVQASMRGQIDGIVHDSSSSGLTIYVEPLSVVELSNKQRLAESEIEREIDRILVELSALAALEHERVRTSYEALVELDFIGARARLAHKYRGAKVKLLNEPAFDFRDARHPLMILQDPAGRRRVVPNDLSLGGDQRTMLITGPNTGGKTVLLKTVGLLVLMIQSGLLPSAAAASCGIFSAVFADIGDEQSIENDLSTFSAHMTNIIDVVNQADKRSLVMFDEVGAGTDPREGTILARVILEQLNECAAVTLASTHYSDLKTVAHTTPGFINASLDFDEATLSPTYKLRMGVPGSSKALAIARRLGLAAELVDRADELLQAEFGDLASVMEQLEERLRQTSATAEEAERRLASATESERAAKEKLSQLEDARKQVRGTYALKIETEIQAAQDLIRQTIAELQRQPSSVKAQESRAMMEEVKKELGWLTEEPAQAVYSGALAVGQNVHVNSLNKAGVIEELTGDPDSGNQQALVRAGALRIKVPASDLKPTPAQARQKGPAKVAASAKTTKSRTSSGPQVFVRGSLNTLDLRGQRVDEALSNLERFIDQSFRNGLSPLMIIHGHGTGKVKTACREYFRHCGYKLDFRPGEIYEGGDGVSVVFLDV